MGGTKVQLPTISLLMVMRNVSHSATVQLIIVFLDGNGDLQHREISSYLSGFRDSWWSTSNHQSHPVETNSLHEHTVMVF